MKYIKQRSYFNVEHCKQKMGQTLSAWQMNERRWCKCDIKSV